jgi:para-nitrobenzyl esterase
MSPRQTQRVKLRVTRRVRRANLRRGAALIAATAGVLAGSAGVAAAAPGGPVAIVAGGAVRGVAVAGGYQFLGLPYAAPPTGSLRWRPPQPPAGWRGVRDATRFAPSCPQSDSPSKPPPPFSEDCLYLNVYTPRLRPGADRPVLVWNHGGGFWEDGARNYDGSKLAAQGAVVVTVDSRLGALGFLAHPALAARPGGAAGNYGLMDQIAALRWVRRNIARFGGDPRNVTIGGQSSGGVATLALLVSRESRGLFQRAIVQSGAFALTQQPLADAEAAGEAFATRAGCPDQTAACLRGVPVDTLVGKFPGAAIPGVIDGRVLRESIGTALAAGRFARVPILNGFNHDEELIFTAAVGVAVSGGTFVGVPVNRPVTPEGYTTDIASVLGVSDAQAGVIAARYPLGAYPSADVAFETLVSDANFACPALQVDRWTARRVPTFAYQFDDLSAPGRFAPFPSATHSSELQYLFDQPNDPIPGTLNADQQALAASMRAAWVSFAAHGAPAGWPRFDRGAQVMSLVAPQPRVASGSADAHHCAFWSTATQ